MLKRENYSSEHIDALRKQTGADPSTFLLCYQTDFYQITSMTLKLLLKLH